MANIIVFRNACNFIDNSVMSEIKISYFSKGFNYLILISEHPKNKCLLQTTSFGMWWHIVFLIFLNKFLESRLPALHTLRNLISSKGSSALYFLNE